MVWLTWVEIHTFHFRGSVGQKLAIFQFRGSVSTNWSYTRSFGAFYTPITTGNDPLGDFGSKLGLGLDLAGRIFEISDISWVGLTEK